MARLLLIRHGQPKLHQADRFWGKTDIDLSDIPEITKDMAKKAVLRVGGERVSKGKVRVNILLDANVVSYFKAKAGGRGYQTLINEALREGIKNVYLETILRRIIREELAPQ